MNPYATPDSLPAGEAAGYARSRIAAAWCAGFVVVFYSAVIVHVVTDGSRARGVMLAFGLALMLMMLAAALGAVLAGIELVRQREGRAVAGLVLLTNVLGFLPPALLILRKS